MPPCPGGTAMACPLRMASAVFPGPAIPSVPPGAVAGAKPAGGLAPIPRAKAAPLRPDMARDARIGSAINRFMNLPRPRWVSASGG